MLHLNLPIKIIMIGIAIYHFIGVYRRNKLNGMEDREALLKAGTATSGIFRNVASIAFLLMGLEDGSNEAVETAEVTHSSSHESIGLVNISYDEEPTNNHNTYNATSSYLDYLMPTIVALVTMFL
jgi:hypothetical protein